jgi:hypothetical protein
MAKKIITKREAREQGLKWFYTGKPCPKGHVCERYVANSECRKCRDKYWERNKSRLLPGRRKYAREHYRNNLPLHLLRSAKWRAKQSGIKCTITVDDIKVPEVCPVLNIPITVAYGKENKANSPTLDRIDSRQGYVPGNVHVISRRANVIKNDGLPSEHLLIYEYFKDKVIEKQGINNQTQQESKGLING